MNELDLLPEPNRNDNYKVVQSMPKLELLLDAALTYYLAKATSAQ